MDNQRIDANRGVALSQWVGNFARQGYNLTSRSDTEAQLVRKKQFSALYCLLWFLLFGVGVVVYLAYFAAKRDDFVYLSEEDGRVTGYLEYTRVHYDRLGISIALLVGAFIVMTISGAIGGGAVSVILTIVGLLALLGWIGFGIASLFGWRRRENIGGPDPITDAPLRVDSSGGSPTI